MRAVRFMLGVVLIPVCVAFTRTALGLIQSLHPESYGAIPPAAGALAAGFLLWLIVYFVLPHPVRSYVLAHELTHALWGLLMGASVLRMKVSGDKGSVTLSKTNFLITLAPYFFPLYTVLAIGAYYVLSVFFEVERCHLWWLGVVGFTWGFHLTFTVSSLLQHQSDIRAYGRLLSYAAIYAFNVLGICLWVVLVSATTVERMLVLLHRDVAWTGLRLWAGARQAWVWAEKSTGTGR